MTWRHLLPWITSYSLIGSPGSSRICHPVRHCSCTRFGNPWALIPQTETLIRGKLGTSPALSRRVLVLTNLLSKLSESRVVSESCAAISADQRRWSRWQHRELETWYGTISPVDIEQIVFAPAHARISGADHDCNMGRAFGHSGSLISARGVIAKQHDSRYVSNVR